MPVRASTRVACLAAAAVALSGCVGGTRVARFGALPGDQSLVTLLVTTDRALVEKECAAVPSMWPRYGCQLSWPVASAQGAAVRAMKIVRYADRLPTPLTFEIDAHELCHAVAALQPLADPCHDGNGGILKSVSR